MSILMAVHSAHVPFFREVYLLPPKKISSIAEGDIFYCQRRYLLLKGASHGLNTGGDGGCNHITKRADNVFHPMLQAHLAGRAGKGPLKRKIGNLRSIRAPEGLRVNMRSRSGLKGLRVNLHSRSGLEGLRVNMRSRSGLKAQQAHSPGQRPGWNEAMKCALKGQKRRITGCFPTLLPFQGVFAAVNLPRALPWAKRSLPLRGVP